MKPEASIKQTNVFLVLYFPKLKSILNMYLKQKKMKESHIITHSFIIIIISLVV